MPEWAEGFLNADNPFFYASAFGLILLAGLGAPLNADMVILVVGYLIYKEKATFAPSIVAILAGILISDTLMFHIAKKYGLKITRLWPFRKILTPERIARARVSYARHGYKIIFAARFMPGIRTVFVFTSGLLGLRYWRFIAFDAAGALIMAPTTLLSVTWVAGNTDQILATLQKMQWLIVAVVAYFVGRYFWKRRSGQPVLKESAETESGPSYPQR